MFSNWREPMKGKFFSNDLSLSLSHFLGYFRSFSFSALYFFSLFLFGDISIPVERIPEECQPRT